MRNRILWYTEGSNREDGLELVYTERTRGTTYHNLKVINKPVYQGESKEV